MFNQPFHSRPQQTLLWPKAKATYIFQRRRVSPVKNSQLFGPCLKPATTRFEKWPDSPWKFIFLWLAEHSFSLKTNDLKTDQPKTTFVWNKRSADSEDIFTDSCFVRGCFQVQMNEWPISKPSWSIRGYPVNSRLSGTPLMPKSFSKPKSAQNI